MAFSLFKRSYRIAPDQASLTKNQQALMILANELGLVVYRGIVQLASKPQRQALLHTLNTEFDTTITLPPIPDARTIKGKKSAPSLLAHFLIIDGKPEFWYDDDNPCGMAYAYALGKKGRAAAQRVSYRSGMTPDPTAS